MSKFDSTKYVQYMNRFIHFDTGYKTSIQNPTLYKRFVLSSGKKLINPWITKTLVRTAL